MPEKKTYNTHQILIVEVEISSIHVPIDTQVLEIPSIETMTGGQGKKHANQRLHK